MNIPGAIVKKMNFLPGVHEDMTGVARMMTRQARQVSRGTGRRRWALTLKINTICLLIHCLAGIAGLICIRVMRQHNSV